MENWLLLGLLAAVAYGVSGLLTKVASGPGHLGMEPRAVALLTGLGIIATFGAYFLLQGNLALPSNSTGIAAGLAVGVFWAVGTLLVINAYAGGADAAKVVPIFNMNTLIVVGLSILLLHEVPRQPEMLRVAAGAVLVVIGGILVSA